MNKPDNAEEFNYDCTEYCDDCGSDQPGIMYHCNDAMGSATPVLWLCNRCAHPPVLVGLYRSVNRFALRLKLKVRLYSTTTRAERRVSRERIANAKRAMNVRRSLQETGV